MLQNVRDTCNEVTESCRDSLMLWPRYETGIARCTAWSGLFVLYVGSNNKNIVAH
jgi:hypothetical protein